MQDQARGRSLAFHPNAPAVVRFDPFRLDLVDGSLWRGDEEVHLPPRALVVLRHLVERAGRVVAKQDLIDAAWKDAFVNDASLTEAIGLIRQALGDDPQRPTYVQTVHRRGYRFIAPIAADAATAAPAIVEPPAIEEPIEQAAPVVTHSSPADQPTLDVSPPRRTRSFVLVAASLTVATAAVAAWAWMRPDPKVAPAVARLSLTLPPDQAPVPGLGAHPMVALTPDGARVVYVGGRTGATRLFVRRMDQFSATPLAGTEGAHGPFVSPDGQWVAFFAHGSLKKVRLDGGEPREVCATPTGVGGTWLSDDEIVFTADWTGPLLRVSAHGGATTVAASPADGINYRWPDRIDSQTVLATRWRSGARRSAVVALDLASGSETVVAEPAAFGRRLPSGDVLFVRDGAVYAVAFDRAGGTLSTPVQVFDAVLTGTTGAAQLALAPNGTMLFIPDAPERSHRVLAHLDRAGQVRDLPLAPRSFRALSVCGDRLAVTIHERGQSDLWVGFLDRAALTRVTSDGSVFEPVWTPACDGLAFGWSRDGVPAMYTVGLSSGEPPRRLLEPTAARLPGSWSHDGQRLAFVQQQPTDTQADIWLFEARTKATRPLLATPAEEVLPRLSPNGRWIAYESDASGHFEIEVASLVSGARLQVSHAGGTWPAWSADSRLLFYLDQGTIYRVAIESAGDTLRPGDPVAVYSQADLLLFRPAGDGFVLLRRTAEHLPLTRVDVVLNGFQGLEAGLRRNP